MSDGVLAVDIAVAEPTTETAGDSVVREVTFTGAKCIAKIISFDADDSRRSEVLRGCEKLSKLRHPNIVGYIGTVDLPQLSPLPVLLTDYYPTNLHNFLTQPLADESIPLGLRVSLLRNAACGLAYLHGQSPPIIVHRHLTAENIYLNEGAVAKIAVDKAVMILPHTAERIPSEHCSNAGSEITSAVDIFSFGVISLFALTCNPSSTDLLLPPISIDDSGKLLASGGVEQQASNLEKLYEKFSKQHPLTEMVTKCLERQPIDRPTARDLVEPRSLLWRSSVMIPDPFHEKTKLDLICEISTLSQAHVKLREEVERHYSELRDQMRGLLQGMASQRELLPRKDPTEDKDIVTDTEIGYICNFLEGIKATQLGNTLGVREHMLAIIERDPTLERDENRKRAKVLLDWMNNVDYPTWDSLVHALTCIGQKRMADILSNDKGTVEPPVKAPPR